jgi:Flp pilus assembly CpaE family ATPase
MSLRSGADLHISKPFQGKALVRSIQELLAQRSRSKFPLGYQVMTLRLARGAGATTVATNLALSLARRKGESVATADMALQGGQLLERLGLSALAENEPARSDTDWMATHLVRHSSGLFALPARDPTSAAGKPGPELAKRLLILREWFDYVVLDTPLNLGPSAPVIAGSSPLLLLLLAPDKASLRKAELGLAAIKQLAAPAQIWPILNLARDDQGAFQHHAEKTLGLPVRAVLPWSPRDCEEAVSNHRPVVLGRPQSPLAMAFQALAEQITQVAHASLKGGTRR